mgnify:CR=1 FL=1
MNLNHRNVDCFYRICNRYRSMRISSSVKYHTIKMQTRFVQFIDNFSLVIRLKV